MPGHNKVGLSRMRNGPNIELVMRCTLLQLQTTRTPEQHSSTTQHYQASPRKFMASTTQALCAIFTILLTFFGKFCNAHMFHASGVYYSYMISGPNFEFRKVIMQLLAPRYQFLERMQDGFTEMSVES